MALLSAHIQVELREVDLGHKPAELLALSPKGTVPVLHLPDGTVLDESMDIIMWALQQSDPQQLLQPLGTNSGMIMRLIGDNDTRFKFHLDRYKYPERYAIAGQPADPHAHRRKACEFLAALEVLLQKTAFLLGSNPSIADIAIFPFVRQFAAVDQAWFSEAPYPHVRQWLQIWLDGELFCHAMIKQPPWHAGDQAIYLA